MKGLLIFLRLRTQQEYYEMYYSLSKRFQDEYYAKVNWEEKAHDFRKIALDLAKKYREEKVIDKIVNLTSEG